MCAIHEHNTTNTYVYTHNTHTHTPELQSLPDKPADRGLLDMSAHSQDMRLGVRTFGNERIYTNLVNGVVRLCTKTSFSPTLPQLCHQPSHFTQILGTGVFVCVCESLCVFRRVLLNQTNI